MMSARLLYWPNVSEAALLRGFDRHLATTDLALLLGMVSERSARKSAYSPCPVTKTPPRAFARYLLRDFPRRIGEIARFDADAFIWRSGALVRDLIGARLAFDPTQHTKSYIAAELLPTGIEGKFHIEIDYESDAPARETVAELDMWQSDGFNATRALHCYLPANRAPGPATLAASFEFAPGNRDLSKGVQFLWWGTRPLTFRSMSVARTA